MASNGRQNELGGRKLKDINVTQEELAKFSKALKDENFRKLLGEYVEEIQDPENRKRYEEEIALLEDERGYDVTWIHPKSGHVVKLFDKKGHKIFINICSSEHVGKPSCQRSNKPAQRGLNWSIPYALSKPREDRDKAGGECTVYDVVFHPDTLYMSDRNPQMRKLVQDTALQAVDSTFKADLNMDKIAFPKLQYKGAPQACIVRRRKGENGEVVTEARPLQDEVVEKLRKEAGAMSIDKVSRPVASSGDGLSTGRSDSGSVAGKPGTGTAGGDDFEAPEYQLVYRDTFDMQQYSAVSPAGRPQTLVLRISLPRLTSAAGLDLDVGPNTVRLQSESGQQHRYKLDVLLPVSVDEKAGGATFDRSARCLVVTLPVAQPPLLHQHDSGIDSDGARNEPDDDAYRTKQERGDGDIGVVVNGDDDDHSGCDNGEVKCDDVDGSDGIDTDNSVSAAEPPAASDDSNRPGDRLYILPRYTIDQDSTSLYLGINEPNVDPASVRVLQQDSGTLAVTLLSVSAGFTTFYYRLCVLFSGSLQSAQPSFTTTADGVSVSVRKGDGDWSFCRVGVQEADTQRVAISWRTEQTPPSSSIVDDQELQDKQQEQELPSPSVEARPSLSISSLGSVTSYDGTLSVSSPNSTDEQSFQKKSILKKRYASESSADEVFTPCSSVLGGCGSLLHSCDETDEVTRAKKAVRFSEHIREKRYRSTATILHDVQRTEKLRAKKKRARARRHSEGDTSENDDLISSTCSDEGSGGNTQPVVQRRGSSDGDDTSENDEFPQPTKDGSTAGYGKKATKKRKNKRKQDRKQKEQLNNELMFALDM